LDIGLGIVWGLLSEEPITPEALIILRPRGEVMMRMRKRKSKD
jgi:hypothetical protein